MATGKAKGARVQDAIALLEADHEQKAKALCTVQRA